MRPSHLDPLFAPAGSLPGIGPKNAKLSGRLIDKPQGRRAAAHRNQAVVSPHELEFAFLGAASPESPAIIDLLDSFAAAALIAVLPKRSGGKNESVE